MISIQPTTCVKTSTSESNSQTITDMLENGNMPNIVQKKTEDNHDKTEMLPPMIFNEMTKDTIDAPWHEILFMSGKKIRDRGNREPQNT